MAVPRNRNSNARKNTKRSHHAKVKKNFAICTNCAAQKMAHVACPSCGMYNGRQVIKKEAE
jgi:large subunit ribosomal protein L32